MPVLVSTFSTEYSLDRDVVRDILIANAEQAPLLGMLLAQNRVEPTSNLDFEWYRDGMMGRTTTINNGGSAYTSGTTTLTTADGTKFRVNDLVLCEATGELVLVTAISTNDITVVRGVASSNGAPAAHANSVANTAVLQVIGHAASESGTAPSSRETTKTQVINGIQTFKRSIILSGHAIRSANITGDRRAYEVHKEFLELQRDIERVFWFGGYNKTAVDAAGKIVRTSGGLINGTTTNIYNVGGTMTKANFEANFAKPLFDVSGAPKVVFAGATALNTLKSLYGTNIQLRPSDTLVGLQLSDILTDYGRMTVVYNRVFAGSSYAGHLVGVELDDLKIRHTSQEGESMMPHLLRDIQAEDADAKQDLWMAELGLQWGEQLHFAVAKGITGAA